MKVLVAPLMVPGMFEQAKWSILAILHQQWPIVQTEYQRTEMRRCRIVDHLMETDDADAVVMLDADHDHPSDVIHRLRQDAEQHPEADVIGALSYRRSEPYDPCAWILKKDTGKYAWYIPWPEGLVEVDAVGFAAVLFRRRCFEVLKRPWFTYEYTYLEQGQDTWPTEDMVFCQKARAAGLRLFVDTTLESPHLRVSRITKDTCLSYIAASPQAVTKQEV